MTSLDSGDVAHRNRLNGDMSGTIELPDGNRQRQACPAGKRILFVDDEPDLLTLYEMMFKRSDWQMDFAENGFKALKLMADGSYDAVISDMRMPELNGAQLLNEVMRLHPRTARFIISGYADRELVMKCLPGTHQFLSKPFQIEYLKSKVLRLMEANEWLGSQAMNAIVARLFTLPSLPTSYFQLLREIESPDAQPETVGSIISRDPAMTAKLLQMVNSAFFGLSRTVSDPTEAVFHLGMETVRSLVLGVHIFTEFQEFHSAQFSLEAMMDHCLRTANLARRIAQHERSDSCSSDDAFTSGLLMDIGSLILAQNLAPAYEQARERCLQEEKPLWDAERDVLGVSHAEVGAYLLALWGLPVTIVEAVLHHHQPARCKIREFCPLACVHVANVLAHVPREGELSFNLPQLDRDWIAQLGLEDHIEDWQRLAEETDE